MDEESCVDCHTSFEKIGNSFLTMFNNTFVSELPFDGESNWLVLNCSYYENDVALKFLSLKVLHDIRTRGGNEEKRCLVCTECKRTFTPTQKILEGFDNACKILDSPMLDPTLAGKK